MEKRDPRSGIISIIFFIIFLMSSLSMFNLPPIFLVVILIIVIIAYLYYNNYKKKQTQTPIEPQEFPPIYQSSPFQPKIDFKINFKIGKWVLLIIVPVVVLGIVLFENWWLNVNILEYLYLNKANGVDWWNLTFLDNYYFYACIAIGLLIALSDPRIIIKKNASGKRTFFLHSKIWGGLYNLRDQIYNLMGQFPSTSRGLAGQTYGDKISIKQGLLWRIIEFLGGTLIVGPIFAKELALKYLLIAKWIETQQSSWLELVNRSLSLLYTRLFTSEMPTGTSLIENSIVLEFLTFLKIPLLIFGGIWVVRLIVSFILELQEGRISKVIRAVTLIGLIIILPLLINVPTQIFDITTPFYIHSMVIGAITLFVLSIFLSLKDVWVQDMINKIFRQRIILIIIAVILSGSLLYGPAVVALQYAPSMQGNWIDWIWKPTYLPTIEYTRWSTGLNQINENQMTAVMDTGENIEILSKVRVFNEAAAKLRLKPYIGETWMDLREGDIVWSNNREYWIAPLTITSPSTGEEEWRSSRMLITHSERVLAIDAANGEIVPIQSVFNLTKPVSMYYGEGGLFESSDMVYIGIPEFTERHLPDYDGPVTYDGAFDYVLTGFERLWFFSGIFGKEQLRWDFGSGSWGDINMLYFRDINERLSNILLPGMTIDEDPYLVSDGENLYWSLYIYIERDMPTEYLDYPNNQNKFWRVFATVLINAYDGDIQGYIVGQDEQNYILDFYRSMYPQWNNSIPEWLEKQLRYPEYLFEKQIASYNKYHVDDPLYWQEQSKFYDLTTGALGEPIEDVRYIVFSLNKTLSWTSVRLVEKLQSPGKNLAGVYLALNGKDLGDIFLLRGEDAAVIGPQVALETIKNFGATNELLTLNPNWVHGNILLYVINNTPYYYIPYYAQSTGTLSPAMMVTVDALSQKVGYYVITNPQDASEVGFSATAAYSDLVGVQIEQTAEIRRQLVIDTFDEKGQERSFSVEVPALINPDVEFEPETVTYLSDTDWPQTQSRIVSFIDEWVTPNNLKTIFRRENKAEGTIDFSVLINESGVVYLHTLRIIYN